MKAYHINLSDVSAGIALAKTVMSGSSGGEANSGLPEFGRCSPALVSAGLSIVPVCVVLSAQ